MIKRSVIVLAGLGMLHAGCGDAVRTVQTPVAAPEAVVAPTAAVEAPPEPAPRRARLTSIAPKLNPEDLEPRGRIIRVVSLNDPSEEVEVLTQVAEFEPQPQKRRPPSPVARAARPVAPPRNSAPTSADAPVQIAADAPAPIVTQPAPASTGGWRFFSFFRKRPKPIPTDPAPTPTAN